MAPVSQLDIVLRDLIAQAIRHADTSVVNEDYFAQADAVLKVLKRAQVVPVPRTLSEKAAEAAFDEMPHGRLIESDYIQALYTVMLRIAMRYPT